MFLVFDSIPDWYKTQEMCDRVVSENYFLILYCPDKYKWSCWWFTSSIKTYFWLVCQK